MSDPKRSKALRTILSLQTLADHPNTPPHEAEAARGRIKALREKHGIAETPPKPPPRSNPPRQDRTGGFNSTSSSSWSHNYRMFFDDDVFTPKDETEAEKQARKIKQQEREYAAWKAMNDEMVRRQRQTEADRKVQAERDEKNRQAREREAKRREEAQKRWQERQANNDAMGRPLTEEDREEARRDPLAWAAKQDKRSAAEKNADMQYQYSHGWEYGKEPPKRRGQRCAKPESFFDPGGEPRKRNNSPMTCAKCEQPLTVGAGALFKVGSKWQAVCCETVPGPRKKKPGRG